MNTYLNFTTDEILKKLKSNASFFKRLDGELYDVIAPNNDIINLLNNYVSKEEKHKSAKNIIALLSDTLAAHEESNQVSYLHSIFEMIDTAQIVHAYDILYKYCKSMYLENLEMDALDGDMFYEEIKYFMHYILIADKSTWNFVIYIRIILFLTSDSCNISESLALASSEYVQLGELYEAIKYRNTKLKKMLSINVDIFKLLDVNVDTNTKQECAEKIYFYYIKEENRYKNKCIENKCIENKIKYDENFQYYEQPYKQELTAHQIKYAFDKLCNY